jgi:phosphoribosylglycinamide formyltransferase-1
MMRLGVLGSTRGTSFVPILAACQAKHIAAEIAVVISNQADSGILTKARAANIPADFIDPAGLKRAEYDNKVLACLQAHAVDIVLLIGYMRIVSAEFVAAFRNRILNVHPSLLPEFAGGMNEAVHRDVLVAGKTETGCSVHIVTEALDAGPVLVQKKCVINKNDSVETLKARVQALEGPALLEAIEKLGALT